jgi:hypothetical protein
MHALSPGSIAGNLSNSKADVLVVNGKGQTFLVSFKEFEGQSKLGQVSADTTYGKAFLDGGIDDLDVSSLPIPAEVTASQTALSTDAFRRISSKDQKLAYYKMHFASSWQRYVEQRSAAARLNLSQFASKLALDRPSFLEFVGTTFGGASRYASNFYIVLGNEVIQLNRVLENLAKPRWIVQDADASTTRKHAILLKVSDGKSTYVLTRIEQSFEGAKARISQTKGIIFHFQQHPRVGMNYKRLLLDLR